MKTGVWWLAMTTWNPTKARETFKRIIVELEKKNSVVKRTACSSRGSRPKFQYPTSLLTAIFNTISLGSDPTLSGLLRPYMHQYV